MGEALLVPPHWPTEVSNGVLRAKRRGRVTESEVVYFLSNLRSFNVAIYIWEDLSLLHDVRRLAERHNLTAYDAAYLELAIRARLPLASLDATLITAATIENVAVP